MAEIDKDKRIKELEEQCDKLRHRGCEMLQTCAELLCSMEDEWNELSRQNTRLMDFIKRNSVITNQEEQK